MVRRFAILQGSGADLKTRVIDDAKESGLNSAYTCKGFARLRSRFFVGFLPRCTHGGGKEESRLVQVPRRVLEFALRSFGKTGLEWPMLGPYKCLQADSYLQQQQIVDGAHGPKTW